MFVYICLAAVKVATCVNKLPEVLKFRPTYALRSCINMLVKEMILRKYVMYKVYMYTCIALYARAIREMHEITFNVITLSTLAKCRKGYYFHRRPSDVYPCVCSRNN